MFVVADEQMDAAVAHFQLSVASWSEVDPSGCLALPITRNGQTPLMKKDSFHLCRRDVLSEQLLLRLSLPAWSCVAVFSSNLVQEASAET